MTVPHIHNSFSGGEVSPSLFGRVDLAKWQNGASTMRNAFGNYRGGASSRAGTRYVGTCLQAGDGPPPRDITFQFNINQGYALEFGDHPITRDVSGAADNGAGLIRLTITSTEGLFDNSTMVVSGVTGTTEANGTWAITVISGTTVDLQGSTFTNAYVSGGVTVTTAGYMRIKSNGAYVIEDSVDITGATVANPLVITAVAHGYLVGDWVFIEDMGGMTELNGLTWIVDTVPSVDSFTLTDLFGNVVDSSAFTAYTSGGTSSRIYTVASPYAAIDIPYLKFTQSKDTMSLCCVNQQTLKEYPTYDLQRVAATNWVFTEVTFTSAITAPGSIAVTARNSTTVSTYYSYTVTAVDENGEESIAGTPGSAQNNDISVNAGSNEITWGAVTGAVSYNIYAATPQYGAAVPAGVLYGFLGSATGTSFVDTNIIADFSQVPPIHKDPFSRGGSNPSSGTYPGVPAYYQQRRVYANTLNQPDTYFFTQPGAFTNMDASIPVNDGDAFTGAPWAQQVNGIQALQPMTNGLIVLTGNGAWLLNGGNESTITSSNQTAQSQAYNGCHSHIPPIVVNLDILYVQAKGSIVRDLSYNFFQNIFTGTDMTILSNHLFNYHQLQQWAYAEEPYKLIWVVRDDGVMLSLTFLKEQDVYTWARHDTNGFYVGVCSVTEPPVDAVYVIVKRYVQGAWRYYAERMDNRNWQNAEDCFCVDAGLSYPMPQPQATLTPAAAEGTSNISSVEIINGGAGYTAPTAEAVDETGEGTGATFSVTVFGGVITAITPLTEGSLYTPGLTNIVITDTTGSGAVAQAIITNIVTFTTDAAVFSAGNVGDVIRIGNNNAAVAGNGVTTTGGGKAVITSYVSTTEVEANIIQPLVAVVPDNPDAMPVPAIAGQWTMTTPVTTVTGLGHLEGLEVAILADGSVSPNQTVTDGSITLPFAASSIAIGLPFTCQLQTLYLEPPGAPTIQGRRKNIYSASVRVETSRGFSVGSNQKDSSTQPNYASPPWTDMKEVKERNALISAGSDVPLYTGDIYINIPADWRTEGQLAVQQTYPLPLNLLAVTMFFKVGDSSDSPQ